MYLFENIGADNLSHCIYGGVMDLSFNRPSRVCQSSGIVPDFTSLVVIVHLGKDSYDLRHSLWQVPLF